MNPWLRAGFDLWSLGIEASTVVTLRMMRLAAGGKLADAETSRMVTEKLAAALALQSMLVTGGLGLQPAVAARKTIAHYRRKVRANRTRLTRKS